MKIKTQQDLSCKDIEVLIRYADMSKRVQRLVDFLQAYEARMKCKDDNAEHLINVGDVFYIESVDKQTFVYLENDVFRTEDRLYQLAEKLEDFGFVQINKSCILNLNVLESIKPLINSRMEATLKNGERLHVTRRYLGQIKQALQGGMGL